MSLTSAASPLVQYWHDEQIPGDIEDCLELVRTHNPTMRHMLFDEASARSFLGRCFGEREVAAFDACAVPAMQADYFRYCAIEQFGGIYCDADARCAVSLAGLLDAEGALFRLPSGTVTNHVFAFSSVEHPWCALSRKIATTAIESRVCENVGMVTGPMIFTMLAQATGGSFEPYLEHMQQLLRRRGYVIDETRWNRYRESTRELIGDWIEGGKALAGVRISPYDEIASLVNHATQQLQHAGSPSNHLTWTGSIYR